MNEKEHEQKEFIRNLKKEVDELDFEVNHTKLAAIKRSSIKNLKIFKKKIRMWLPYIIVGTLLTVPFCNTFGKPFVNSPTKTYARVELQKDSYGNYNETRQYYDFNNTSSYLYVYSKWENKGDYYERSIKTFSISEGLINTAIDIIESDKPNLNLLSFQQSGISYQKSNNLTFEEINDEGHMEATLYYKDKNDTIVRMRYPMEILKISSLYLLFLLLVELLASTMFSSDRKKCCEKIKEIKDNYKIEDLEELRKRLIIKKDNYERLTRV